MSEGSQREMSPGIVPRVSSPRSGDLLRSDVMKRAAKLGLIAAAFLLASTSAARAQSPISVEVARGTYHIWDPVTVRIKNLTTEYVRLVIPVNISAKGERTIFQVPLDLERLDGDEWKLCFPVMSYGPAPGTLDVYPGGTREFALGVAPPGRYRVRAWYLVDPGDLGPPKRLPVFESVVSEPFDVLAHEFIPAPALPAMAALSLNPLRLCGTLVSRK
jgi:hypothetical protein